MKRFFLFLLIFGANLSWANPIKVDSSNARRPIISVQLASLELEQLQANFSEKAAKKILAFYLLINDALAPIPMSGNYHLDQTTLTFEPYENLGEGLHFRVFYYLQKDSFSCDILIP